MLYGLVFESHRRYNFFQYFELRVRYRRKKVHVRYLSSADECLLLVDDRREKQRTIGQSIMKGRI